MRYWKGGLMATVIIQKRYRNNKLRYYVYYKDPYTYRSKYYKTFTKAKDAQRAANKLRDLIDNGKFYEIKKHKQKTKPSKFSDVANKKFDDWTKQFQRDELSQATLDDYTVRLNVLNRVFGDILLFEISKKELLDFQQELFDELSPVSSNRYMFIIKQVFKKGLNIGAVLEDPSSAIKYFSEKKHERNNYLMPFEIKKLVKASQKTRAKFYMPALIYLGAEHGTSKQEALSLQWTDIKFDAEGIGMINLFRTKNSKERTEYLMPRTRKALLDWKTHLEYMRHRKKLKVKDSRFVFCRLNGTPIKRFDKAWRHICRLVGFEDFHYHDLRHTFCSNLIMSGAGLKETKDMIGHNDISMTDRYSHLSALHKKALQERLAERYNNPA